ncbi:MAG: A/G-specific adenine glycosylase [Caulobacterales bacterium]|nr:A/G-specific adenine glycosylase [Caulobacterales bacterium]
MDVATFRTALLDWYDAGARELPWRVRGGRADPYGVWLSEVMLQQTTVPHATPYWLEFLRRWPTVDDLAVADDGEVMSAWAGLGYYARARNLLACARVVAGDHGGIFPDTEEGLRALPGVGPYTAAAVAAIAFDRLAHVVDGNVERVVARLFRIATPLPKAKSEMRARAAELTDPARPGDWAQAMMDLGAMICRPRAPLCERCPVARWCAGRAAGDMEAYPVKTIKTARPRRYGAVYVLRRGDETALVRRSPKGLLGGMLGLPTTDWADVRLDGLDAAPVEADWKRVGEIEHVFTHFSLTLDVWMAEGEGFDGAIWSRDASGLPSVFLKAVRLARTTTSPSAPRP